VRSVLALTIFGGGVAHATLAPALRIGDVAPDIPLIVVVLLALRRGPEFGAIAGFAAGLLQDVAGGGLVGAQAQPLVQVTGLVVLSIAEGVFRFALLKIFYFPAPFGELMAYVVLPQALYNGFLGAALVLALAWADAQRHPTA